MSYMKGKLGLERSFANKVYTLSELVQGQGKQTCAFSWSRKPTIQSGIMVDGLSYGV